MQTTTAAATLAAAQTVNDAAVRALRHAAVAVAVLVVSVSLPTAVIVADLDAAAASTACVVMGALVVVGALVVGVSSLLDDLRATAAESHLRSARLADRENALWVAENRVRVVEADLADLRNLRDHLDRTIRLDASIMNRFERERDEARVRDHAATDAALAQVQRDAERAEARAVAAEAEVARLRSDLSAVRVTMAEQVVAAQVERDAARADLAALKQ